MKQLIFFISILWIAGIAGAVYVLHGSSWQYGDTFVEVPTDLQPYDLYDIGAAKIDSDDTLDIYTVNHSSRQQVLYGNSETALMSEIGLGQVRGYPGAEAQAEPPEIAQPGLYIYRQDKNLHIVAHQLDKLGLNSPYMLSIELPWPMDVVSSENATVEFSEKEPPPSITLSEISQQTIYKLISVARISLTNNSNIVISGKQQILELPHGISIDDATLRKHVFVGGGKKLTVPQPFEMMWRDRHSMIWRDIDNDNDSDVFIARGGVKGQLTTVPSKIDDEFLVRQAGMSGDIVELSGMKKNGCPGRQSAWTDANADEVLDIHISCGRVAFEDPHPDQIYIEEAGRYKEMATEFGLDYEGVSVFKWADYDVDGDLDLFTAQSESLVLYTNNGGNFSKTILKGILLSKPTQIVVADFDHDADLDAFVVQRTGSLAILNTDNSFSVQAPENLGLPSELRALSVVDFDNDGYTDVHVVPGGLFRAVSAGRYEESKELSDTSVIDEVSEARCVWIDQDMDGLLDPSCAVRVFPPKIVRVWKKAVQKMSDTRYWLTRAAKNQQSTGYNWIHIDLNASSLNSEGIGSVVTLTSNGRTQIATVGQSDSAHYSQGHYRLYFGLGDSKKIDNLTVYWPGGMQEVYSVENLNTLIELSRSAKAN